LKRDTDLSVAELVRGKYTGLPVASHLTICKLYQSVESCKNEEPPLQLGIAACSVKDQFCKRTGRQIAIGRANHHYRKQRSE